MWTRIQMPCGPTSGYTLIPRLIFGCHLCCALRSHVRVQAEAGPYCCRLVPMSVRMDLRNAFTSKPIRIAWKDHSHENPVPLPLSFSARSGFHRHRFDMQLKAVCKILIVYNPSRCSSVRLRSDRTKRMFLHFVRPTRLSPDKLLNQPVASHQQTTSWADSADFDVGAK